ncbi:FAD-binding domain-containing protein [Patellaria atrata CBS 101060]|uniref:FAD-binding domain-containing protein n=1 Tax=Patellaria atrata CBS 101060 TaxID=1346257 RepID=A0A9P4SJQ4_9PEZI|nr:FAD-binding domain-containing protein [Patellaria atrata CBS 101060]
MLPFSFIRNISFGAGLTVLVAVLSASYFQLLTTSTSNQCAALSSVLRGKVFYPADNAYQESDGSYWRVQETTYRPSCILIPTHRDHVATALKTLTKNNRCKFAVRGGGHTLWNGASNINSGVTIDMRKLNGVTINRDRTVVSAGAGALWGDVYRKADVAKIAVIGARAADVGVAGLTLGGGINYFSARKGFACDNVINFEVVLASGRIVNANTRENSDLWHALKGGANNLGIVTRFDLSSFSYTGIWGGQVVLPDSVSPQMLKGFAELNNKNFDEYASMMLGFSWVYGMGFLWTSNMHYTKPDPNPRTFRAFTSAQPQLASTVRISNQTDFTEEFMTYNKAGSRAMFVTNTFVNDLNFLTSVHKMFKDISTEIQELPGVALSLTFQPISRPLLQASERKGGNVLGLERSEAPLVLCLVSALWSDASQDEIIYSVGRRLTDQIIRSAKKKGLFNEWVYLNYASSWQDPLKGYGERNKQKLRAASRKYDPTGVFQKQVPGGFKLFN